MLFALRINVIVKGYRYNIILYVLYCNAYASSGVRLEIIQSMIETLNGIYH